jgi:hypothetical protein
MIPPKWIEPSTIQNLIPDLITSGKALKVLEKRVVGAFPKDIDTLARNLGLPVIYTDELPDNVGGMLTDISDKGANLIINNTKTIEFQQFSIAHELGHFFLYHDHESCPFNEDRQEQQANLFAFSLLGKIIPAAQLKGIMRENPDLHGYGFVFAVYLIWLFMGRLTILLIPFIFLFAIYYYWKFPLSPTAGESIKREQL